MNRAVLFLGVTLGVVVLGVVTAPLFVRHPKPPEKVEEKRPPRPVRPAGERAPTLLDQVEAIPPEERPRSRMTAHTSTPAHVEAERPVPPPGAVPALVGLEVVDASSDELRQLKVPEGMTGVVVRAVDPASPAAEAALKRNDVIVRAQRDKITSTDVLRSSVAERDHTLLTVYRDGYPFQVVIHKPFKSAP